MKKYLILFLLSISIFIGYNKVGATTTLDYDTALTGFTSEELASIKSVIDYLDSNNENNIPYVIYSSNQSVDIKFLGSRSDLPDRIWVLFNNYQSNGPYTGGFLSYTYKENSSNDYYSYRNPSNISKIITINFNDLSSTFNDIDSFFSNVVYNINAANPTFNNGNSQDITFDNFRIARTSFILYTSQPIILSYYKDTTADSFNPIKYIYNGEEITLNNGFFFEAPLNLYYADNEVVVNSVKSFGNNTFGFYQNVVGLNATSLSGAVDTLSIICEENRLFVNGYCSMNYDDFKNHNSDINVFNNYALDFTQLFGNNSGYLYNDKYYLYSFRIQKPFVPQVGNIFINSLTNNSNQVNILGVYLNDGGSYTDYVVKFKIENSNYDSSTNLKDILVVFQNGIGSYYNNVIPNTFNYSVYRSFKLQYFDTEPTMSNVNDFYNNSDLATIDGISSQNSFFTDNEFNSFGFGGIITAPFRFLYALENYESCSDINVPFPHSNQNLTLTCVRKNIPDSLNSLIVILQVILSGIITYRIAVGTLKIIKEVSSPDNANIEVVDL